MFTRNRCPIIRRPYIRDDEKKKLNTEERREKISSTRIKRYQPKNEMRPMVVIAFGPNSSFKFFIDKLDFNLNFI